jgi:flagella basal body P-ring formation protein FlgA
LVGQGRGFAISAEGIALSSAAAGQNVRVRTESGRIVTGVARASRTVEVSF